MPHEFTIGEGAEVTACVDQFSFENVVTTLTVMPY